MIDAITLNAEGYKLTFEMQELENTKEELDLAISVSLDPRLDTLMMKSVPMPIMMNDLQRMVAYLEQHIANLQENPDSESYTFVPLDLQFQMQAFAGEVRSPDDGEFTLRFMVNVGRPEEEGASVYIGGQTIVTLENINLFISSIRGIRVQKIHS